MVVGVKSRRHLALKIAAIVLAIVVVSAALYWFVIDPLIHYESLELFSYFPYQWVSNSKGEVRQVVLNVFNNGTKMLTIDKIWVNGTLMSSSEWGCHGSGTIWPVGSRGATDTMLFIAPINWTFKDGWNYNFTIGTASGKHFTFIINVDEANKKQENLTIKEWGLHFLPNLPSEIHYIGIWVRNGPTYVIVKKVTVNETVFNLNQWIYPNKDDAIIIFYGWKVGKTYHIRIETAAGNAYELIGIRKTFP